MEHPDSFKNIAETVLSDPEMEKIYANGFMTLLSTTDVAVILKYADKPKMVVSLSYTTAKSLSIALTETIKQLESKTGSVIMTNKTIEKALKGGEVDAGEAGDK